MKTKAEKKSHREAKRKWHELHKLRVEEATKKQTEALGHPLDKRSHVADRQIVNALARQFNLKG